MPSEAKPIYFHGIPGGASELALFGPAISARCSHFAIAKRDFPQMTQHSERIAKIADSIRLTHSNEPLNLIGFSIGAATALKVSVLLGSQVRRIDLISAAAPLDLGDYLGVMAGAPVFRTARDHPVAFKLLSRCQSWLAKISPATLYTALFSSAQGADIMLRENPHFRSVMIDQLKVCFQGNLCTYRSEIQSYIDDWSELVAKVSQPVSIYHGRCDNWSPIEMATDLAQTLKNCDHLQIIDGCSHYSTLEAYLRECCRP